MFVPQAGKTLSDQRASILIIRVSIAVCAHALKPEKQKINKALLEKKTDTHVPCSVLISAIVSFHFL